MAVKRNSQKERHLLTEQLFTQEVRTGANDFSLEMKGKQVIYR